MNKRNSCHIYSLVLSENDSMQNFDILPTKFGHRCKCWIQQINFSTLGQNYSSAGKKKVAKILINPHLVYQNKAKIEKSSLEGARRELIWTKIIDT